MKTPSRHSIKLKEVYSIFKVGGTIAEATSYAGVSSRVYHLWIEQDEVFAQKMEAAQHYADVVAKNVVVEDITKNKDVGSAKWWLEKREFKNSYQTNIQVNLPILGEKDAE